jgi:phage terminase small subunit
VVLVFVGYGAELWISDIPVPCLFLSGRLLGSVPCLFSEGIRVASAFLLQPELFEGEGKNWPRLLLLGLIRKEIYYREGFGGTTISEKYPDIFTVRGPKNGTELKKQDKKLLKEYDKYLETKDLKNGPDFYKNGSYRDITRVTLSNGLTMREEKFCLNYIATADPIEAWIKSGYDHSYPKYDIHAREWVRQPKIQERINELMEEAKVKMRWDADMVLDRFNEIYKSSMAEQDHTNASRSMEQIAKHLGMFVDRTEQRIGSLDSLKSEDIDTDISKLAGVVGLKVVNGGKD